MVHLEFLLGVVPVGEDVDLRNEVVGKLVGKLLDLGLPILGYGSDLLIQLGHTPSACPAGCLIGRHVDTCDRGELVDDVEGDDHLDGRTVGVGDDPTWADEGIGSIDLGDDEGDILLHAKGTGVVDHDRPMACDRLGILEGNTPPSRDEGYVNITEVIVVLELTDGVLLATEGDLAPCTTSRGKEL